MAVAFDAVGGGNNVNGAASPANITWSHTATGSNRCVVVGLCARDGTNLTGVTRAVTYGGVSMTSLGAIHANNDTARQFAEFFYLLNPATGAQTVSVTCTHVANTFNLRANSVSYTGVGSVGTLGTSVGLSASLSQTVSSATGNMVAQAFIAVDTTAISAYNKTSRYNFTDATLATEILIGDAAGAASVAFTATMNSNEWSGIGVDLQASVAGNSNLFFAMF